MLHQEGAPIPEKLGPALLGKEQVKRIGAGSSHHMNDVQKLPGGRAFMVYWQCMILLSGYSFCTLPQPAEHVSADSLHRGEQTR